MVKTQDGGVVKTLDGGVVKTLDGSVVKTLDGGVVKTIGGGVTKWRRGICSTRRGKQANTYVLLWTVTMDD